MPDTHGTCTDQFAPVREALAASPDDRDVGASVAVYVDGEPVVDLWGGYADAARTVPWERDTITNVWSTTKTMAALCALVLADRGALDLAAPVAAYRPEFAAAGKEDVRVRHLLSHTAGLPAWSGPMTVEDLYDWPTATARLAAQEPAWKPGTEAGYHSVTYGHLIGEVVRRVTGRSTGTFLAEEVTGPLCADFHIGLAAEHDHRVAPILLPPPAPKDAPPVFPPRDGPGSPTVPPGVANTPAWRRAEIPAANGHGNARVSRRGAPVSRGHGGPPARAKPSVGERAGPTEGGLSTFGLSTQALAPRRRTNDRTAAAVQPVLACGGAARGVRLLSAEGCERVLEEQFHGTDRVLGVPMRYGMGYGLNAGQLPNPRTCFWGGWGGSLIVVDLDARMAVSYVMNQMIDEGGLGDERGFLLLAAVYEGLSG
ncbi:serine hydrolase domain-containing protein [Streptomyces sp. NPDC002845]